ncbi:UNVERIFIED_CONTAM: hypothetical protein FKN15_048602 [Acipenser sinensis]
MVNEARTEGKVGLHSAERMRGTVARMGMMGLALLLVELVIALVPWLAHSTEHAFPRASFYLLGALSFATLLLTALLYILYSTQVKTLQGAEDQMRLAVTGLQERLQKHSQTQPVEQGRVQGEPTSTPANSP